jgi:hypothetical protein
MKGVFRTPTTDWIGVLFGGLISTVGTIAASATEEWKEVAIVVIVSVLAVYLLYHFWRIFKPYSQGEVIARFYELLDRGTREDRKKAWNLIAPSARQDRKNKWPNDFESFNSGYQNTSRVQILGVLPNDQGEGNHLAVYLDVVTPPRVTALEGVGDLKIWEADELATKVSELRKTLVDAGVNVARLDDIPLHTVLAPNFTDVLHFRIREFTTHNPVDIFQAGGTRIEYVATREVATTRVPMLGGLLGSRWRLSGFEPARRVTAN